MKHTPFLLLAAALGLAASLPAATIGPDAFGYVARDVQAQFLDISSTGTQILTFSDDDAVEIPIGFGFSFYGSGYSTACVSSNGVVSFGGCEPSGHPVDVAASPTPNDLPTAAVLWDDWQFYDPGDGSVFYQTIGLPGDQSLVIQWNLARGFPSSPQPVTFEAILREGSNILQFLYLSTDSGDSRAFGASASVGIRDTGGDANGRALSWSAMQPLIAGGTGIEFEPGVVETPEPASAALLASGLLMMAAGLLPRRRKED